MAQDGWLASQKLLLLGLVAVWVAEGKIQVLTMDMVQCVTSPSMLHHY